MRTTLTLDDDLVNKIRQFAHRRHLSLKDAVDALLRRGLASHKAPDTEQPPFRVQPFHSPFRAGVDPMKLNQLLDDLSADEFARRTHTGHGDGAA